MYTYYFKIPVRVVMNYFFQKKKKNYLLVKVVHHFVISTRSVDFGNDAWRQAVHELAQDDAVPKNILVGHSWWESLTDDGLDPCLSFLFLNGVAFSSNLKQHAQFSRIFSLKNRFPSIKILI